MQKEILINSRLPPKNIHERGVTVMKENSNDNRVVRAAAIATPLILLGKGIKPEIIRMPVAIDRVAPTLSSAMRIRAPNACTAAPLN